MFTKFKRLIALGLLALLLTTPVLAQAALPVRIGALNISEFPKVTSYIDVRGSQGFFISGLPGTAATVFEDEQPLTATITEARPGAQIVVAYAGGENFGIFNLEAKTRYQVLADWMLTWAGTQVEAGVDSLSLLVPEGVVVNHEIDPLIWTEGLQNYVPEFNLTTSPLEILSAAIDNAMDPLPQQGMGRAVLFLTQGIPDEQQAALQSQIDRAAQAGVRLHIGYINSANLFQGNDAIRLQAAAFETGGQYFAFSSEEALPDLNLMMESSRRAYLLEYRSQINSPGTHTITVMINSDSGELLSNTVSFEANLSAPVPVFVSPPDQIVRSYPPDVSADPENLAPTFFTLDLSTEFPDSIPRQVSQVSLYINETLAVQVTEPPFDKIPVDLTPFQKSEMIEARLEVTDELGMTGSSMALPIEVLVLEPEGGFFSSLGRNVYLIVAGVVGVSGAVLFLVLVLAGRLRPRKAGERRQKRKAAADPVTSPVRVNKEDTQPQANVLDRLTHRLPAAARIQWPARTRPTTDPYGYLVRIAEDGEPDSKTLFPITAKELTFGSDSRQAVLTLDDAAIEPLHARLWIDENGSFFLADADSVSGTYINYTAVNTVGSPLCHGDLIHIGHIGYRFTSSKPNKTRQPTIVAADQSDDPEAQS
ncbi:MAG: FHA domain-containing protein [Anaerolineales bacterium]